MSFIERRNEIRPATGEAPFHLNEVFFSRTDKRGVIKAGNYVFRRTADYDWSEMIGAPHKIIRHPDMPKGVFWLLWDTIKRGEEIGAYVKNRAKDGLFYWVYATVMPCQDGFLSIRIKPTSPLFATVKKEYASLLLAEKHEGLSPEQSAARLLERIRELGFEDYAEFSAHSLSQELVARDEGMGWSRDRDIERARKTLDLAQSLERETVALIREFETMRTIPHNMRVIASRLEPTGGPVSTLSQNYGAMSQEISDWFEEHVNGENSNFTQIKTSTTRAMFHNCMARILTEARKQLESERRSLGAVDLSAERAMLSKMNDDYLQQASERAQRVVTEAERIAQACKVMHRQVLGLSTTRVMCKIEGARIGDSGESLHDIIMQLETFQSRITARLDKINHFADQIRMG